MSLLLVSGYARHQCVKRKNPREGFTSFHLKCIVEANWSISELSVDHMTLHQFAADL